MAPAIMVLGASLGGFQALKRLLGGLPADFPLPLVVVQHRGHGLGGDLAGLLQRYSALPVCDAEDKLAIEPGRVCLAPPGYHVLVEADELALSTEAPVGYARPSIDVLFESAADAHGAGVVGVVLTGSSHDGVAGLAAIKRRGGLAIVQDPATAESPILPRAAIASVAVDAIRPLDEIAPLLVSLCHSGARS